MVWAFVMGFVVASRLLIVVIKENPGLLEGHNGVERDRDKEGLIL